MKLLLLSMGLALVCGLQPEYRRSEEDLSDEKEQKWEQLSGHWHTVGLASSDRSLIEEEGPFRNFVQNITVENGNLNGLFLTRKNGQCTLLFLNALKTNEAGHFKLNYYGTTDIYYESSKPNEYVIFILYNHHNGKVNVVANLFGRTPNLSNEIKKKFEEYFTSRGFRKENILDVSEVAQNGLGIDQRFNLTSSTVTCDHSTNSYLEGSLLQYVLINELWRKGTVGSSGDGTLLSLELLKNS
ncbi:trichosurin-like [Dromiciops gliroides]|uniref:trichosurin-like n=1 Tax=Dromiciops gliroides TaxID=33562 RepID=UPI001CC6F363|nr:trichosurin-like [Dromiciops gliroides]